MTHARRFLRIACTGVIAIAAAFVASPLLADTTFGVRTGVYTDANAGFVGGEVVTSIAQSWYANPNVEMAFNGERDVVTLNGDFHYDFFKDRPYWVWAGGGPALIHRERPAESSSNDLGVNFLGGMAWKTKSRVSPYIQGKVTVSDSDEAVLAAGVRF